MEAPYRFMISSFSDVEQLFSSLAVSPHIVPNSIFLTEGAKLLARQLAAEQRQTELELVTQAQTVPGIQALLRSLWDHPLTVQQPRFLRFDSKLIVNPKVFLSLRIDVPTVESHPRWVEAESNRDPAAQSQLLEAYQWLSQATHLKFVQV